MISKPATSTILKDTSIHLSFQLCEVQKQQCKNNKQKNRWNTTPEKTNAPILCFWSLNSRGRLYNLLYAHMQTLFFNSYMKYMVRMRSWWFTISLLGELYNLQPPIPWKAIPKINYGPWSIMMHGRRCCCFGAWLREAFTVQTWGEVYASLRLKNPGKKHGTWITPLKRKVILVTITFGFPP